MATESAKTMYLPTIEACEAYGIPRYGTRSRSNGLKFLTGPQFNNMRIAQSSSIGSDDTDPKIDEIILQFIGNQPYKLTFNTQTNTSGTKFQQASFVGGKDDDPILNMRIAPNTTDWINFSVKHQWEKPGGLITSLFESVTSLISAGNGIVTKISNATKGTGGGGLLPDQQVVLDQADAYKSSDNVEFTVPFLLWSAGNSVEDWIRDIYFPIMLLTAWSHPRRATTLAAEDTAKVLSQAQAPAPGTPTDHNKEDDISAQAINFMNKIYPGTRITILDPPSYIRVKHTSGLFNFNRCVISSFGFKYMDPWVKATTSGDLNTMGETLLKKSLPMRAECSLTLRSIEKKYADDWISMYQQGLQDLGGSGAKVTVDIAKPVNTQRTVG